MTVRSEEEFSPKHSGIQTDTQATVIAAHPEFNSRGGWGTSEMFFRVIYHVCLVPTDASHDLPARYVLTDSSCLLSK